MEWRRNGGRAPEFCFLYNLIVAHSLTDRIRFLGGVVYQPMKNKYVKAIYNGDVVEFYIMDRSPLEFLKNAETARNKEKKESLQWIYEALEGTPEDRKELRRKQTLRDARNNMRRLALRNFKPGETLFKTLTYRDDEHLSFFDIDTADKHFRDFIDTLREESEQNFHYIAVREFTKRGRIHFHMLTDFKIDGDLDDPEEIDLRRWERDIARVWGHGFVDIKITNEIDNVGAYLSKYMTKDIFEIDYFKNKKYYLCSQGLKRPEILTGSAALALYQAMKKENEVYTNSYESEYLGNVIYKEYNLKRKS